MTGHGSIEGRWSGDLPDDLLGAIYSLCSSSYDRARFAAVCKPWRAAASWQPKLPALPLLLPSTGESSLDWKARAYSPEDGRVLRSQFPWLPYGKQVVGSHDGGWIAAASGCRVDVVNLFTGVRVLTDEDIGCTCLTDRPTYNTNISIQKSIFSEDPASDSCILVVLTRNCITLCRPGGLGTEWTTRGCSRHASLIIDIAFCDGKLYVLLIGGDLLFKISVGLNDDNTPVVISLEKITIQQPVTFSPQYIFQLGGKLATAAGFSRISSSEARTFRVFELASSDTPQSCKCMWTEVTSLGKHALFLGPGCCKAVHMPGPSMRGEVERNRIYYSEQGYTLHDDPEFYEFLDRIDPGSCAVYCCQSKGVDRSEGIMSRGYHYYYEKDDGIIGHDNCTWILPPQF